MSSAYILPGLIGLGIYFSLFLYTFYNIITSSFIVYRQIKYFNYKISFHFIFLFYCSCEIIYSFSLFHYNRWVILFIELGIISFFYSIFISLTWFFLVRITTWGYITHFIALFLYVLYFSMVWIQVLVLSYSHYWIYWNVSFIFYF